MVQRQKSYLLNAFLLGVITGFFIAPLKNGIQVHVSSRGTCSPKKMTSAIMFVRKRFQRMCSEIFLYYGSSMSVNRKYRWKPLCMQSLLAYRFAVRQLFD